MTAFTTLQGQYLAFIDAYTKVNGRPPAQADMQRYFEVTPPVVHQMVINLHRLGLISRSPCGPKPLNRRAVGGRKEESRTLVSREP